MYLSQLVQSLIELYEISLTEEITFFLRIRNYANDFLFQLPFMIFNRIKLNN